MAKVTCILDTLNFLNSEWVWWIKNDFVIFGNTATKNGLYTTSMN